MAALAKKLPITGGPDSPPRFEVNDPKETPWYRETLVVDDNWLESGCGASKGMKAKEGHKTREEWDIPSALWGRRDRTRDGKIRHWKPITLEAPILAGFMFISISLIILLEYLAYRSRKKGDFDPDSGLVFASTINNISTLSVFIFQYLPTVIAVVYSMIWGWVDLDAKRLEPWFQLSKPGGASAEDSLLLQYPFDFLALVPWRAAKKRHWPVLFSGLTMMVIFWVITPLQSAIFTTGQVERTQHNQMSTIAAVAPISEQVRILSANFLNTGYGVSWLSQKLPAYTTREYAIIPFEPVAERQDLLPSETWTTEGDALSTTLNCSPALITYDDGFSSVNFDNQKGCVYPTVELPDAGSINASHLLLYVSYYPDSLTSQTGYWLQSLQSNDTTCGPEFSNNFLAIWGSAKSQDGNGTYHNLTALFCEPSYQVQHGSVRINASDQSVISLQPTSEKPLPDGILNITNFEYIIGTGAPTAGIERDYSNATIPMQYPRLLNMSLASPTTSMVGYAVAAMEPDETVDELYDPLKLQAVFEKAHKLLFSMAVSDLIIPITEKNGARAGILQDSPAAIIFVRPFSIAVEAALGLVSTLTAALWYFSFRRHSMLLADPASMSKVIAVVQNSGDLLDEFKDDGTTTATILQERLSQRWFRLVNIENKTGTIARLERLSVRPSQKQMVCREKKTSFPEDGYQHFQAIRPRELHWGTGIFFITALAIAIAALSMLFWESTQFNGIHRPTSNRLVLTILENLVPTAFASLLEPFWVVLNRLLCLLQPFEELRIGHATASSSVDSKYTSLPPQLTVWRALKSGHFLLAAVCTIAISSNLLAVALSGLVFEQQTDIRLSFDTKYEIGTVFNGTAIANWGNSAVIVRYFDPFYVVMSNITHNTSLPAWADSDRFYVPFDLPTALNPDDQTIAQYAGTTRGFGANVQCKKPGTDGSNTTIDFKVSEDYTEISLMVNYTLPNGSISYCTTDMQEVSLPAPSSSASALEITRMLVPATPSDVLYGSTCGNVVLLGWVRLAASSLSSSSNTTAPRSLTSDFLTCIPTLSTALFNITLTPSGHLLSSTPVSPAATNISPFFPPHDPVNATTVLLSQANNLLAPDSNNFQWHSSPFTLDWPNTLLKTSLRTSALVDPASPLPATSVAAAFGPAVENLYRGLFATLLALNTHVFAPPDSSSITSPSTAYTLTPPRTTSSPAPQIQALATQTRIFLSKTMFYIALLLLILHILVAVTFYLRRPEKFLPRMPTTIGSLIAYVSASNTLSEEQEQVGEEGKDGEMERTRAGGRESNRGKKKNGREGRSVELRYGYGWFIGRDGRGHVGIDRQEHIVPLRKRTVTSGGDDSWSESGSGSGSRSESKLKRRLRWGLGQWTRERDISGVGSWI